MKRLSAFLMMFFLLVTIELFNGEDLSMTSHDLKYNFTSDALAALNADGEALPNKKMIGVVDPTTMILLGSGVIGLIGFGRRKGMKS